MAFKETQTIHEYYLQSWLNIAKAVGDLAVLGKTVGLTERESGTIWYFTDMIDQVVRTEMEAMGKQAIYLIDADAIVAFMSLIKETEALLLSPTVEESRVIDATLTDELTVENKISESLFFLGLSKAIVRQWLMKHGALPPDSRRKVDEHVQKLLSLHHTITEQLTHVGAVLGISMTGLEPYSIEELDSLYVGDKNKVNFLRVARSFSEFTRNEYHKQLVVMVLSAFADENFRERATYKWQEIFLLHLMIHAAYASRFELLAEKWQEVILQTYAYRGIIVGAPVRKAIEQTLFGTRTVREYISAVERLLLTLDSSLERIPLSTDPAKDEKLVGLFIQQYQEFAKDGVVDDTKQNEFIQRMYPTGTPNSERYSAWLKEFLSLYFHLQHADLIDHNRGGELTEDDLYHKDIIHLLAWFGIGKDGADDMVKYFKRENHRVPFLVFVKQVRETAKLKDEVVVANCLEVAEVLQKKNLLSVNQEFIEFHEEDGKFYWSDWVEKL